MATAVSPGEQQWQKLQACIPELLGLPHRKELVHVDEHGTSWLNDSKATNVESVRVLTPEIVLLNAYFSAGSALFPELLVIFAYTGRGTIVSIPQ